MERGKRTGGTAVGTELIRPAEREVWAAEGEHFVAASQCVRGTTVNCSVFWGAGKGVAAVVGVSCLEESLGVGGGGEGQEDC